MAVVNDPAYDTDLLDTLSQRVMVDLTLDDFNHLEGCNEILNEIRPDVIEAKYVRLQSG